MIHNCPPPKKGKIDIDLAGPDGNAFVLLGMASNFSKQLGISPEQVRNEMTAGDYPNLVKTFDRYFGEFINLYNFS